MGKRRNAKKTNDSKDNGQRTRTLSSRKVKSSGSPAQGKMHSLAHSKRRQGLSCRSSITRRLGRAAGNRHWSRRLGALLESPPLAATVTGSTVRPWDAWTGTRQTVALTFASTLVRAHGREPAEGGPSHVNETHKETAREPERSIVRLEQELLLCNDGTRVSAIQGTRATQPVSARWPDTRGSEQKGRETQ